MNNWIMRSISMIVLVTLIWACNDKSPGLEYMPDMYRSPAIEPYVDNSEYGNTNVKSVREPVKGTIPRGFTPYAYENSTEGYELAGENLKTPILLNEQVLADGKQLYGYFCTHCHGKTGDGKGTITHAVYGAVPSYADATPNRRGGRAMKDLREGHIYHVIMFGLNAMGPHNTQINEEERWKIVHYVQSLQGNSKSESEVETAEVEEVSETAVENN